MLVQAADGPLIFDRATAQRRRAAPGSGLSLAIIRQIAESHGGRVEVEDAEGGGMTQTATLGGTVLANTVRSMVALAAMVLIGLLVGFRPESDLGAWLAVIGLLLLVSYAFSWLPAVLGLAAGSVEAAWQMSALVWPLTFISSAFVPPASIPRGLEGFAANQPMSEAIDATRALLLGKPVGDHLWVAAVWCVGIPAVSATVARILFKRKFS